MALAPVQTNTRRMGHLGIAVFVPALTLLLDPQIVTPLLTASFPHMSPDIVKIIGAFVMGYAGWLLLYAKSPDSVHPDAPDGTRGPN